MTWLRWLSVGKQLAECAVGLLQGEACSFRFTWRGIEYTVTVKRG